MIRQRHFIAVVGTYLIGCAVLLMVVGCAGVRSEAPEEQVHTEATASEEARCEGTRTLKQEGAVVTTNDVPGCPKGGLLSGTDKKDNLDGKMGDDEIRGLGAKDGLTGGSGSDVIYGGEGEDSLVSGPWTPNNPDESSKDVLYGGPGKDFLYGAEGDDVLYGGDGNDYFDDGFLSRGEDVFYGGDGDDYVEAAGDRQRDKLYCGEGEDHYTANKLDYVDSSCEVKDPPSNL